MATMDINCDICGEHLGTEPNIIFRIGWAFCEHCRSNNEKLRELLSRRDEMEPENFYCELDLLIALEKHGNGTKAP